MGVLDRTEDTRKLANEFSRILWVWLTREELEEVNKRNSVQEDNRICHSHDFIDANMAMVDAYEITFRKKYPSSHARMSRDERLIVDGAWQLAKSNKFKQVVV